MKYLKDKLNQFVIKKVETFLILLLRVARFLQVFLSVVLLSTGFQSDSITKECNVFSVYNFQPGIQQCNTRMVLISYETRR